MKLDMVGIITKNMEQALAFYQVLGLYGISKRRGSYLLE